MCLNHSMEYLNKCRVADPAWQLTSSVSFSQPDCVVYHVNAVTSLLNSRDATSAVLGTHSIATLCLPIVVLNNNCPNVLQDHTQIQSIDAVIYCTGYQYAYPFLEGTGLVTSHDMRVDPLWQHIFPPSVAPTLAFVGLAWKSIRNQQFELQVCCNYLIHVYTAFCNTAQHGVAKTTMAQHSTQHTAQHSTAQHSTAQHSTAQHSTAQRSTAQHSTLAPASSSSPFPFHHACSVVFP